MATKIDGCPWWAQNALEELMRSMTNSPAEEDVDVASWAELLATGKNLVVLQGGYTEDLFVIRLLGDGVVTIQEHPYGGDVKRYLFAPDSVQVIPLRFRARKSS